MSRFLFVCVTECNDQTLLLIDKRFLDKRKKKQDEWIDLIDEWKKEKGEKCYVRTYVER
jgi:hypothetical protein